MGAIRRENVHLPKRLYEKHGAFWYVCQLDGEQVWQSLGADEGAAVTQANALNAMKAANRMLALAAVYQVEETLKAEVLARDEMRCVYCGWSENLGIDHVIPFTRGGSSARFNLVACCLSCNASKGDQDPRNFIAWMPKMRTELLARAIEILDKTR